MYLSEHCTITATVRPFSSRDGKDAARTEYNCDSYIFRYYFRVSFYVNGSCAENEGHVSIVFKANYDCYIIDTDPLRFFSCTASVIDASGNKRFPQSFAADLDYLYNEDELFRREGFGFDKFLKRSALLDDSCELLHDDCLTLCLDIDYETYVRDCKVFGHDFEFSSFAAYAFVMKNGCMYLRLDCEFGRELCKLSPVFRDMMECPIVESLILLSSTEFTTLWLIYDYLREFTLDVTLSCICSMYQTADKYDMQPVIRLCHQLLVSVMRAMNTLEKLEYVDRDMHLISKLARRFEDDERLREILEIYSDTKNKIEGRSRGELYAWTLETEWNCEYIGGEKGLSTLFQFSKNESENIEIDI